jgi:SAM-dependent methyltransferase
MRMTVKQDAEPNPWLRSRRRSGDEYDETYERRAAAGENVHGEADFVMRLAPRSVLDAGCGTGRIARELARRGVETVGVDLDDEMLSTARRKAPDLELHHADLATIDVGRVFDVVLLAGNVMIFLTPGSESAVVANLVRHLAAGGAFVAGFSIRPGQLTVDQYDGLMAAAGLSLVERWSTWDRDPWRPGDDYQVSLHRGMSVAPVGPSRHPGVKFPVH